MDTRIPARLYRLDQVCEALSLGRTTVKQLMYDGHLDSIKVGRLRLVPVDSIDRFIAARLESKVAQ